MACTTKSDAARGEVADLLRARKGSKALRAFVCSMAGYCGVAGPRGEIVGVVSRKLVVSVDRQLPLVVIARLGATAPRDGAPLPARETQSGSPDLACFV